MHRASERRYVGRQPAPAIEPHAVTRGVETRHQAHVCGKRQRRHCAGGRELRPIGGQPRDDWHQVGRHVIRAQRVERDQHDIATHGSGGRIRGATTHARYRDDGDERQQREAARLCVHTLSAARRRDVLLLHVAARMLQALEQRPRLCLGRRALSRPGVCTREEEPRLVEIGIVLDSSRQVPNRLLHPSRLEGHDPEIRLDDCVARLATLCILQRLDRAWVVTLLL